MNCSYKNSVTFEDTIQIDVFVKEFTGVKFTVGYHVTDKKNGDVVIQAETKHCFTNNELRPIALKRHYPEFAEKLNEIKVKEK